MQRYAVAAWLRMTRVFHKIEHRLTQHLRPYDLSLAHFDVLAQLQGNEGITQQELADRLLVTKGNVCQILDRMMERGLLVRRQEGRINRVFLTERGRQLAGVLVPEQEALMAEQFAALSPAERHHLLRALHVLDRSLS
jgi:DNA-binding MarR family transcriptional regulator